MRILKLVHTFVFVLLLQTSYSQESLTLIYEPDESSKAVLYNPLNLSTSSSNEVLSTESSAKKSNLVSVYARKKVVTNTTLYAVQLMDGYNGYNYTIISFEEEKAVEKGKVSDDQITMTNLKSGTYSVVVFNGSETIVQVFEKI